MADLDAVNLGLDETEADIADELLEDSFDTRSEASGSSSSSSNTGPSISSVSTESSVSPKTRRINLKRGHSDSGGGSGGGGGGGGSTATGDDANSTKNGSGTNENHNNKSKSRSPEVKRNKTVNNKDKLSNSSSKSYDYMTKLNYLFRDTRFFVIKSNNADNITLSKSKGVWSTLPQNEANLNLAFRESRNVLLIFSVKESGKFAGFARMNSESKRDGQGVQWVLPPGLSAKALGGYFKVDWICKKELSFTCTGHLFNPWNDGKPVKIGRDGQEIEPKVGSELCRLFPEDENVELTPILKKSKEASKLLKEKKIVPVFRPPPSRGGIIRGRGGLAMIRGRKKLFLTSRSKMAAGFPRSMSPYGRERIPHWDRYSSTAAAEAYVADYMRTMQHQLPPMPYAPPPGFSSILPYDTLPPPRYYDGIPLPEYPQGSSSTSRIHDKRQYDRSVDDFLYKSSDRPSKYYRDYHHRGGGGGGGGEREHRDRDRDADRHRDHRDRDRNNYRNDKDRNHRSYRNHRR